MHWKTTQPVTATKTRISRSVRSAARDWKDCNKEEKKKCIDCNREHGTMKMKCPKRKDIITEKRRRNENNNL